MQLWKPASSEFLEQAGRLKMQAKTDTAILRHNFFFRDISILLSGLSTNSIRSAMITEGNVPYLKSTDCKC